MVVSLYMLGLLSLSLQAQALPVGYVQTGKFLSYFDCLSECLLLPALSLPCIDDANENAQVAAEMGESVWISFGKLIDGPTCTSSFHSWGSNVPINANFVALDASGFWSEYSDFDTFTCICEMLKSPTTMGPTAAITLPPPPSDSPRKLCYSARTIKLH